MTWIDWIAAITLFLLGCVHNFIAAPMSYESFSTPALWFITGGITLWYAAIINFLWLRAGATDRTAARLAALSNFILLGFAISFVYVGRIRKTPFCSRRPSGFPYEAFAPLFRNVCTTSGRARHGRANGKSTGKKADALRKGGVWRKR